MEKGINELIEMRKESGENRLMGLDKKDRFRTIKRGPTFV